MAPYRTSGDPHGALDDPTYRSGERGAKGRGVRCMGLLREAGGVDLVVQDDYRANPAGRLADRDSHRGQEVSRALGPRKSRVAHCARYNYWGIRVHEKIQNKGRLFYGVGPLSYHDALVALVDAAFDLRGELDQIIEG